MAPIRRRRRYIVGAVEGEVLPLSVTLPRSRQCAAVAELQRAGRDRGAAAIAVGARQTLTVRRRS